jgi:hypothetical protein
VQSGGLALATNAIRSAASEESIDQCTISWRLNCSSNRLANQRRYRLEPRHALATGLLTGRITGAHAKPVLVGYFRSCCLDTKQVLYCSKRKQAVCCPINRCIFHHCYRTSFETGVDFSDFTTDLLKASTVC